MASSTSNSIQTREGEEDNLNLWKEVHEIFDKFLKSLVAIIAFKVTDPGKHVFKTHPSMMTALVLAIMLFFSAWLLLTALHQLRIGGAFLPFMACSVLAIGVIVSVWALITIF